MKPVIMEKPLLKNKKTSDACFISRVKVLFYCFLKKKDINTLFCWFQKITPNYIFLKNREKTRKKNLASNKHPTIIDTHCTTRKRTYQQIHHHLKAQ
jgi:hypothetical protein